MSSTEQKESTKKNLEDKVKEEVPQIETEEQTKLSEIFDWKLLMSVKGDGKGLYYTRVMPHPKTGMMQLAKLDMTRKVTAHQNDVRPIEMYLKRNAGRFFDVMDRQVRETKMSLNAAAIEAVEEVNNLMDSEYILAVEEAKTGDLVLPARPTYIEMYNTRRFVNWYIFINQVLAEMTAKQKEQSETNESKTTNTTK